MKNGPINKIRLEGSLGMNAFQKTATLHFSMSRIPKSFVIPRRTGSTNLAI